MPPFDDETPVLPSFVNFLCYAPFHMNGKRQLFMIVMKSTVTVNWSEPAHACMRSAFVPRHMTPCRQLVTNGGGCARTRIDLSARRQVAYVHAHGVCAQLCVCCYGQHTRRAFEYA
jgi:hypothetical protein